MNKTVARAFATTYSRAALEDIKRTALECYAQSATVTRSFEGSSLTISKDNATSILEDVEGAIDIIDAGEDSDGDSAGIPLGIRLNFQHRRIE